MPLNAGLISFNRQKASNKVSIGELLQDKISFQA
jgi:hypothetical protein